MRLENSFTVAAPLDRTWATLLDIERVASCLPGALIEPGDGDGVHRGAMKVKLGAMTVDYRGTVKLQDVDEDAHTASIVVRGHEAQGQGLAAAVIENQLEARNGGTRVITVTDLNLTGRQAQFGRGIIQDVAETTMAEFAKRLEQEVQRREVGAREEPREAGEPTADARPQSEPGESEALDLGNVLAKAPAVRYVGIGGGALLVIAAVLALVRPRRKLTVNINLRR